MRSKILLMTVVCVVVAAIASQVTGQIVYGRPASGGVQVAYSQWTLKDDNGTTKIGQLSAPLRGFLPISDNFEGLIYLSASSNSLDVSGVDSKLSGLSNMRMQFNRSFSEDRYVLSCGLNLPTGKKQLTAGEEVPVLQMLTQNYLDFPMHRFGEGFGFNVLAGTARMVGQFKCGGGIAYQYTGQYKPYEGSGDYDPGDVVSFNAGADWQQDRLTISGNVFYAFYGADKAGGKETFKQSTQLNLSLSATHTGDDFRGTASLAYLMRGRNTLYTGTENSLKIYGDEFHVRGVARWTLGQQWFLAPSMQMRLIGENDEGFGSSTIFGLGGAVGRSFGEQIDITGGVKYFTGQTDGGDIDLSGLQIRAGLTAKL